ncbi:uncharacterized protein BDV14DRAFT_209220 [Aspergillus stella-maris]|uniref:uncharacterized protein n=1 Tax=Aspergillus stella-maris TaxID=1810926 RepID=UPI003CCE11CF
MNTIRDINEVKDSSTEHVELPNGSSKHSGLRRLYIMMPILFPGSTIDGYDGSLLNGLQTMPPWRDYFGNPTGSDLDLLIAIHNIGGISAVLFSSYVSDLFGRRAGVALGIIVIFVGAIVQSVPSVKQNMFIEGRFLVGLGSNVSQGSAPLLVTELAHPQHRGSLTTMYNTLIPVALQAAMSVIQFFGVWLLPESPRWLCAKGKIEDAFDTLVKYHGNGDMSDKFCEWEFHEIQNTIRLEKENSGNSWLLLVKTPGNRKRLLLVALVSFFSQCSGNGLVSYYIHSILESVGITSSSDQAVINGRLQIWSFLVAIGFSAFLVDVLGRRKLFVIAAVGICSAVYDQNGDSGAGGAVIAMIFRYYGVAGFAWPALTVAYCAEILPFNIRARGIALNLALAALSSVFNQYVNPIGLENLQWRFYFVYLAILVVECLCIYFLFVETKGPTLEEVAALFDGESPNISSAKELGIRSKAVAVDKDLS